MIKILFSIFVILAFSQAQQQNLRIATAPNSAPFELLDANGQLTGFDIDFLAAVAQVASLQYDLVQLSWADLFNQVEDGQVDLAISAITITDERLQTYDFSVPYFVSTFKILAKAGTDITSALDLSSLNKIVGVREGTTPETAVEGLLGADNANIRRYQNFDDATAALNNGDIDAIVDDGALTEYYANNNAGYVVIADADAFAEELFGLMFAKGSGLKAIFDPAITTVLQNGQYTSIYTQWLGVAPDVALLLQAGQDADPYDVFEEGETGNEEWDWDVGTLLLL